MWHLYTVISATKLVLLISLGLAYLLGLGWLAIGAILHGSVSTRKSNIPLIQQLPLLIMGGIVINYGMILSFQSLKISLIVGCIVSIFGICWFVMSMFRYHKGQVLPLSDINKWIGIAFVCLLFLSPMLAIPLGVRVWDAHAIWFFHAKMIYAAGSIGPSAGWQHPSVVFSHTDYPNLIPALAAQVTYVIGFWNEYIPKISLFFMFVPAAAWLFTFARRSFSFIILLLLIPFSLNHWLWDGHMDGYLALYFSVAMLLIGRYVYSSQPLDMISSIFCLISLPYIKNEGALATLIGLCIIALLILFQKKLSRQSFLLNWQYYLVGLIALLPFALWTLYKQQMHLFNDLDFGSMQSNLRIISRFNDGSYKLIFQDSYKQFEGALLLLGLLYFASAAWNKSLPKESVPALLAAGIYFIGIAIIYLSTPHDLVWHLDTSIDRTMLSVNGCLFIGSYYILNSMEEKD